jgi:hypothetical protein
MNKLKIILTIFIIFMSSSIFIMPNYSQAKTAMEIKNDADSFLNAGTGTPLFEANTERSAIDAIYYLGLEIGVFVAIIVGMILGIQFITGGVTGQAKVKEKLIPYCIGAFVVFGAFGIWRIVLNVMQSTFE